MSRGNGITLLATTSLATLALSAAASEPSGQWASTSPVGPPGKRGITTLAIDPRSPDILYAGRETYGAVGNLYRTLNGGATWRSAFAMNRVFAISVSRTGTVYAAGTGVYKSSDRGTTWTAANAGIPRNLAVGALAIAPGDPRILYAAAVGRVFRSTDAGGSWRKVDDFLDRFRQPVYVSSLAVDPRSSNVVYAGMSTRGVYKTTDGGATWAPAGTGLTASNVQALVIDPTNPDVVYAGSLGAGVFKSRDAGATWSISGRGYPRPYAYALAIDRTAHNTVYAAYDHGVARTTDGGASWADITTGAPKDNRDIQALAVQVGGKKVFAASFSRGVLYFPAPLEGVVSRGWISTTKGGPPVKELPSHGAAIWAHFDFAAVPVRGPVAVTFIGPLVRVAQVVKPRSRTMTASFSLKSNQVFRPGAWRVQLSVRGTVLKTLEVRVRPS